MSMKNNFILLLLCSQMTLIINVAAQGVAINTSATAANVATILDLTNTSKLGLLVPRVLSISSSSLTAPAQGLLFYNTSTNLLNVNTSATITPVWVPLGNSPISNALSAGTSATNIISTVNGIVSNSIDLTSAITTSSWGLAGNSITLASTTAYGTAANNSYLGTTNAINFLLETNSTERMRIATGTGNVGIGTTSPYSTLEVNGTFGSSITKDNYTITNTNAGSILYFGTSVSGKTLTLPTPATSNINRKYLIVNAMAGSANGKGYIIIISPGYKNRFGSTVTNMVAQTSVEVISDGANWYQIN